MNSPVIGIDLGTSYSCVGVVQNGKVDIIPNDEGSKFIPSYVSFDENERLIGDSAKNKAALNTKNTFFNIKRVVGRKYNDPCVQNYVNYFPFQVINDCGKPKLQVTSILDTKTFTPEEIYSVILNNLKQTAENHLKQNVSDAVITVPAYFNDFQIQATRDAGLMAGLNVRRIIKEPIAIAMAYGLDKKTNYDNEHNVLIFDLGGGSLDVSIMGINNGMFEIKSTNSDINVNGDKFDQCLVDHFTQEFQRLYGKDICENPRSLKRLRAACERAKYTLSNSSKAIIEIDALHEGIDFCTSVNRTQFEELCSNIYDGILMNLKSALRKAKLNKNDIQEVILVGGSSHIPSVQTLLQVFFEGKVLNKSIDLEEAVTYGAALQGNILNQNSLETMEDILPLDVAPFTVDVFGTKEEILSYFKKSKSTCSSPQPCTTNSNDQATGQPTIRMFYVNFT